MAKGDVSVDGLWKTFRIYQQRNSTLKQALVRRKRDVFEEFWALRDVSFELRGGSTLGMIGANGAGKSTMLKVLARVLVPDKGAVKIDGRVSALLELGSGFHPELSGRENVFLNGTILGMTQREVTRRFDEIVAFSGLEASIDKAVKTYSSGMQARLGFAVAAAIEPDVLIIDEVLAVGDEQFQRRCLERINELRSGGRTAIFVSHGLGQVQQICDSAIWLDKGRIAATGHTEDVINAYLRSVSGNLRIDEQGRPRTGTGEIRLDAAVFSNGTPSTSVATGDPLTITLFWACERTIDDVQFVFRIHTPDGIVVAGERSRVATDHLVSGVGQIEYTVPKLSLLPGTYHVSAEAIDRHTGHIYDGAPHLAGFDVVPRHSHLNSLGCVELEGAWSV